MTWAEMLLYAMAAWLGIGAIVGLVFLVYALPRVDPAGKGSSFAFRVMVFPGCLLLWPALIVRWRRG